MEPQATQSPEAAALVSVLWKLAAVSGLVLINGFFVAAEFAFVRIRETQLAPLVRANSVRAKRALHIVSNLDAYIGATQLGITLAGLGVGAMVEPFFTDLLSPLFEWGRIHSENVQRAISFGLGFFVNSYLLIVVGELGPKALAIRRTLPTALWVAAPLQWFYRASFPFIWLLNYSSQWLLRQLGIEELTEAEQTHSEEELRLLFAASQKHSGATVLGREIVLNALDLRRRVARDVMRPRPEMVCFDTTASIEACLELAERTRYSRFPLCEEGNLDKTLGVVHIKDLYALRNSARTGADLTKVAKHLIYVPETARLEKLLQLLLERKLHFAVVVDEYGGTLGMLTLENILEELVGQIQDEFDHEKPLVVKKSPTTWEVLGSLPVHDLAVLVGEPLEEEGITTASGWVTRRLGGFPKEGDFLLLGDAEVRVVDMSGPLVARLEVKRPAASKALRT